MKINNLYELNQMHCKQQPIRNAQQEALLGVVKKNNGTKSEKCYNVFLDNRLKQFCLLICKHINNKAFTLYHREKLMLSGNSTFLHIEYQGRVDNCFVMERDTISSCRAIAGVEKH